MTRFMMTWRSCVASASTIGISGERFRRMSAFLEMETSSMWLISAISALTSSGMTTKFPLPE